MKIGFAKLLSLANITLAIVASPAHAQFSFVPGQILTAQQLNVSLSAIAANALPLSGGTLGGPLNGPSATFANGSFANANVGTLTASTPISVANGGTGSATALGAASTLQYKSSVAGAGARTFADKFSDTVNIKDFGARCDGSTDDAAAIQLASNTGVSIINAPENATCVIKSAVNLNRSNQIFDLHGSQLVLNDATGAASAIVIGNGTSQINNVKVRNGTITRTQVATSGYLIDSNYASSVVLSNLTIYGGGGAAQVYGGIRVKSGINWDIHNNYIYNVATSAVRVEGTNSTTFASIDVTIKNNRIDTFGTGIDTWDFTEGLFVSGNVIYKGAVGMSTSASSAANALSSFMIIANDIDTLSGRGWYANYVQDTQFNDNWVSNTTGDAVFIDAGAQGVVLTGCQMYPNTNGIHLGGSYLNVSGNYIAGGTNQVVFDPTATGVTVRNNLLNSGQVGVDATANPSNITVAGNDVFNASSAAVNAGSGSNNLVTGNHGDSEVGQASSITVGSSPYTYTSGPRPEYVTIAGGTVTSVKVGATTVGSATNMGYMLPPNVALTVTYSTAPTMAKVYQN